MGGTQTVTPDRQSQVLEESAREQRRVVLTHEGPDGWRLFKGHFAFEPSAPHAPFVHIPTEFFPDAPKHLAVGQSVGCTFRVGHRKWLCATTIASAEVGERHMVLRLNRPDQIQQLQRRAFERAEPPPGTVIAVRFWPESGRDHSSQSERVIRHGQLDNISAGGMRISVPDPQDIELETMYRCVFTTAPGRPAFVLDAFLRHHEAVGRGRASLGFQFVGLETTPEGRKTLDRLARLVSHFQRARQRRRRPT